MAKTNELTEEQSLTDHIYQEMEIAGNLSDLFNRPTIDGSDHMNMYKKRKGVIAKFSNDLLRLEKSFVKIIFKLIRKNFKTNSHLQFLMGQVKKREHLTRNIIAKSAEIRCLHKKKLSKNRLNSRVSVIIKEQLKLVAHIDNLIKLSFQTIEKNKVLVESYHRTSPFSEEGARLRRNEYIKDQDKIPMIVPVYCANDELLEITERMILTSIGKNYAHMIQLIIVDDLSPLESDLIEIVTNAREKYKLDVKILRNEANLGYARSVQRGIDNSDSKFFIMANNDIYIPEGSIDNMLAVIKNDPDVGAIGPVSSSGTNNSQFSSLGPSKLGKYNEEVCRLLEETAHHVRTINDNKYYDVRFLCGWFILFNREAFERTGGFNPLLSHSFNEDSDISWGLQQCGYKLVVDKSSYIFHGYEKEHGVIGPSMKSISWKSLKNWARNAYHFAHKYGLMELNTLNYNFNYRKRFPSYFPPAH